MTMDRLRGSLSSVAIKPPARVATTSDIALVGVQTIDGVALAEGDRVLVKNQSDPRLNGIYLASLSSWRRAPDFNGTGDAVMGTQLCVNHGSTQANFRYKVASTDPVVVGTDSIVFEQISDGPQGPPGIPGATGPQGPAGAQGPPGASGSGTGDMLKAENLTGLANTATARGNLGLGALATLNSITAAQIAGAAVGIAQLADAAKVFDIPFNAGFTGSLGGEDLAVRDYGTLILTRNLTIEGEVGNLETVATGAAVILDVTRNGSTIYSSKPQFAISSAAMSAGILGTTTADAGDRLIFKVTQAGSTIKGQKLRFALKCRLR
jgi:hypothetical protein